MNSAPRPTLDRELAPELGSAVLAVRGTVSLFLAFQEPDPLEDEDLMDLSGEERKERIRGLEELLSGLRQDLDDLKEEAERTGEISPTIGSLQQAIREVEIELAKLKAVQALAERLARELTPEQWRKILREAIRDGQEGALILLAFEIFAPIIIAYGIIGIRAFISFLLRYFRPNAPPPGPTPMPWDQYANRLARLLDRLKQAIRDRDFDKQMEALRKWREFMEQFSPVG